MSDIHTMKMRVMILVVVVLGHHGGEAVLDSLRESLANAKDFLRDALPYLTEAYRTVKRASEFTDSVIDEDCLFTCPNARTHVPVPREGHIRQSNGCGALNVFFNDSDESPIRLDREFTGCCDEHDFCYDTCNSDKDLCDLELKKCLYAVCRTKQNELFEAKPCKVNAKAAYLLVMALGCQMYKDAQKEACRCVAKTAARDEL